jgi:DNA-binding NarL/FixJ family response regulator
VTIRVLLADDQPLLRLGYRMVLSAEDDIEVVGEAADGAEAVRAARLLLPDVVLMDVRMPGTDGIEAARQIVAETPQVRVIILTTFDIDQYAFTALRAGASGFLLKNVPPADLLTGIRAVASGDAIIAPSMTRRLLDAFAQHLPEHTPARPDPDTTLAALTEREREVFEAIAAGLSNAEIAAQLVLSEATVKTHISRIFAKLQLRDRVQVVILAYQLGVARA